MAEAIRLYNICNDRMTYRAGETVFDFKNEKARLAEEAQRRHTVPGRVPVSDLEAICAAEGDGFGSQHTGPRSG